MKKVTQNLFLLILLGMIWGTGYSIARFAMTNGIQPLAYSFWQSVGPAIILGTIAFFNFKSSDLSRQKLLVYAVTGLTGIAIPNTMMYFAAPHLPAGILATIVNIVPIVTYPLALLMRLEKFHWQRFIGILLAVIGLLLIILPKSSLPNKDMVPWVLSTLITPLCFAICAIFLGMYRPKNSSVLSLSAGMLISSSIFLLPLVWATHNFYFFNYPLSPADWIILLEILLSSIGYLLFILLIKKAGPVYYSLVDSIVVLTGIFWGYTIFHEHLNKWTASAIFFIVLALILVTQHQKSNLAKHD